MTLIIQAFHRFNHALPHSSDSQALCGDPVHYIQFSGRRVQEIEISNLADLLEHEKTK